MIKREACEGDQQFLPDCAKYLGVGKTGRELNEECIGQSTSGIAQAGRASNILLDAQINTWLAQVLRETPIFGTYPDFSHA